MVFDHPMMFLALGTLLLTITGCVSEAQIGVCYGMLGDNLPHPREVISLYNQYNIRRMRLYNPNQDALQALSGSDIELIVGVTNEDLETLGSSQDAANSWVQTNILNHRNVKFRYIAVGNELHIENPASKFLVSSMLNVQNALQNSQLGIHIKVSTAVDMGLLGNSYPPSQGSFRDDYAYILDPLIRFLSDNNTPLLLNVYPYFAYTGNPIDISLDYALFRNSTSVTDGAHIYTNLFDAMLDATYSALEKKNGGSVSIVVAETGWPSNGGFATSTENAMTYVSNMIQHVKSGTPKRPGRSIESYAFAMFDENQKNPQYEKFWGLFLPNKQPKYNIHLN